MRKYFIAVFVFFLFGASLYAFRHPIMRWFSSTLTVEDPLQKVDAMFVLSGGGYDRGNEAAKVVRSGYAGTVICTGGNPFVELKVFNIDTLESDMTVADLKRLGIADSQIIELRQGTSTQEESAIILNYCRQHQLKKVMVLSSKIHTRRINEVFRQKFKTAGVELIIHGAPSSRFDEKNWWKTEDGMIAINNEWMKRFYYWWKY